MAYYRVGLDSTGYRLVMTKATSSPGTDGSWSSIDNPILVSQEDVNRAASHAGTIKSVWCYMESTNIHVATQQDGGRTAYHIFSTSSDTWTTRDEYVAFGGTVTDALYEQLYPACSIALRSDGDVIIGYGAAREGAADEIRYARKESGTWTVDVDVASATGLYYTGVVIVRGTSDRMHFFFKDLVNDRANQRTLNSANSLESMPSAFDTTAHATGEMIFGPGFLNGTTVKCPYIDADGQINYVEFTSADAPTPSINDAVSDNDVEIQNSSIVACAVLSGTDEYLFYSHDTDNDLYWDLNDGADTQKVTGTAYRVSANVYDDGGTQLAYFWLDNTTEKYGAIAITGAATYTETVNTSAVLQKTEILTVNTSAVLQKTEIKTVNTSANLSETLTKNTNTSAILQKTELRTINTTAVLQKTETRTVDTDEVVLLSLTSI
jgi:hypothetical protein